MHQGFIKVAAGTPEIRVGDCTFNAARIGDMMDRARAKGARVLALPELCITGYTAGDLLLQDALLDAAEAALREIAPHSAGLLVAVGLPVRQLGKLYNCAAVLADGALLGIVPKRFLPNYGEFDELRHFTPAPAGVSTARLGGWEVPFGAGLLFRHEEMERLTIGAEICEDLWVPAPPSAALAAGGATIVLNLSASVEAVGKEEYRRLLLTSQSARLHCGYVYADAGYGESTTDLVFAGHNLIVENGQLLAESRPFESDQPLVLTEVDVQRLAYERRRRNTFPTDAGATYIPFVLPTEETTLTRTFARLPFVPAERRGQRMESILSIQAQGLRRRLAHAGNAKAVIGLSGGLDSTLALLVCVRAMALSGRATSDIIAVTMPCFGTTERTRGNAEALAQALGVPLRHIDITEAVKRHFLDIGHPEAQYDTTFENAQARERTQVLMDIANQANALVIGTGDLSELALGWATYNGDHMSMYGVNASIPKTLVRHLVAHCADAAENAALRDVLRDILDTPVSPELLPAEDGEIAQQTERIVGPYELHDFFLYHFIRWGCPPEKIFRLAQYAFAGAYDADTIRHWLRTFLRRFYQQQYKRSCMPDGPKVGSVSLSPRGDWRMPSDAAAIAWE